MKQNLVPGQRVLVSHLRGEEEGIVDSVNYMKGKVLVFCSQEACPNYDSLNLSQVAPSPLGVVEERNGEAADA